MKRIFLLLVILSLTFILKGQVFKTVNTTAGVLSSLLSDEEKTTVTNLTVKGIMDARDFKTLRDSMPVLAVLDLSEISIDTLSGREGTASFFNEYSANEIPREAFSGNRSLTSIILPTSITSIGWLAFSGCSFSDIDIPSTVTNIGMGAFQSCDSLTSIIFPESVDYIGERVFMDCIRLKSVVLPPSLTSLSDGLFVRCGSLTSAIIPEGVTSIGNGAFIFCSSLTSVSIPTSVTSIDDNVFGRCSSLDSIFMHSSTPVDLKLSAFTFYEVNFASCKLYVPYKSAERYAEAFLWQDFSNIIEETDGFLLDSTFVNIAFSGGTSNMNIEANIAWSASSDQTWITVNPESGTGDSSLTFTVEPNPTTSIRTAIVTVAATGITPQNITITQAALPVSINITAGNLSSYLTTNGMNDIVHLILSGTIDQRDFVTMRDSMPRLAVLDLSETTIVAYTDPTGPVYMDNDYPANAIPNFALEGSGLISVILPNSATSIGELSFLGCEELTSISIPSLVTSIGEWAFNSCVSLTSVFIPESVKTIGSGAFAGCIKLTSVVLSEGITSIEEGAFSECSSLISVTLPSSITVINENTFSDCGNLISVNIPSSVIYIWADAFRNCSALTSVAIPSSVIAIGPFAFKSCSGLTSMTIPTPVEYIGTRAFSHCSSLTSVSIPSSVTDMGQGIFDGCTSLSSIYVYSNPPVDLSSSPDVFRDVNMETCMLCVPPGAKTAYQDADQWGDFIHILEGNGIWLSDTLINVEGKMETVSTLDIASISTWSASFDQTWLTVSPKSGSGNDTLIFTAEINPTIEERSAIVTLTTETIEPRIIKVLQAAGDTVLQVSETSLNIDAVEGSTASLDVISNTSWSVATDQTWLSLSTNEGVMNGQVIITAEANSEFTPRTALVFISSNHADLLVVNVTQEEAFDVSSNQYKLSNNLIYPNPATEFIMIKGTEKNDLVSIFNLDGILLIKKRIIMDERILISNLIKGIYLVKIESKTKTIICKLTVSSE